MTPPSVVSIAHGNRTCAVAQRLLVGGMTGSAALEPPVFAAGFRILSTLDRNERRPE